MPPPLHVILHIGTEKTGTKTLQHSLLESRSLLHERGIHYLTTPNRIEARSLAAAALCDDLPDDYLGELNIQGPGARQAYRDRIGRETREALKELSADIHTVAVSSEHFHSRLRQPVQLARLRRLLGPRAGTFRIVCYLRRQVDLLASYYSTELKNGGTRNLQELARAACRPSNAYYDFAGLLARWSREFGEEALAPALFVRNEWPQGDLLEDFLLRSGIAALAPGLKLSQRPRHNQSVTPEGQALLLALNRRTAALGPGKAAQPAWQRLRGQLARAFAGKGETLRRADAEACQAAFDGGNEAVRRRWFPARAQLFEPLPPHYGFSLEAQKHLEAVSRALEKLAGEEEACDPHSVLERCITLLRRAALQQEAEVVEGVLEKILIRQDFLPRGST